MSDDPRDASIGDPFKGKGKEKPSIPWDDNPQPTPPKPQPPISAKTTVETQPRAPLRYIEYGLLSLFYFIIGILLLYKSFPLFFAGKKGASFLSVLASVLMFLLGCSRLMSFFQEKKPRDSSGG